METAEPAYYAVAVKTTDDGSLQYIDRHGTYYDHPSKDRAARFATCAEASRVCSEFPDAWIIRMYPPHTLD